MFEPYQDTDFFAKQCTHKSLSCKRLVSHPEESLLAAGRYGLVITALPERASIGLRGSASPMVASLAGCFWRLPPAREFLQKVRTFERLRSSPLICRWLTGRSVLDRAAPSNVLYIRLPESLGFSSNTRASTRQGLRYEVVSFGLSLRVNPAMCGYHP